MKVCYSDVSAIQMFAIQIPTVPSPRFESLSGRDSSYDATNKIPFWDFKTEFAFLYGYKQTFVNIYFFTFFKRLCLKKHKRSLEFDPDHLLGSLINIVVFWGNNAQCVVPSAH